MGVVSDSNRKLLIYLEKHYMHPKFKSGDFFCQLHIIFLYLLYETKKT